MVARVVTSAQDRPALGRFRSGRPPNERVAELAQRTLENLPPMRNYDEEARFEEWTTPPVDLIRQSLITTSGLKAIPKPECLIDGVLVEDTLAELYSRPGAWKSFIAMSWACCIATGTPWAGHEAKPGVVLYVLAEGAPGMGERVAAWEQHNGLTVPEDRIVWHPAPIALSNAEWATGLGMVARERDASLVVIDTRARCTVGVEENSSKEMGQVVQNLDIARAESNGATVLLLHHSDATGTKSRGSTSVLGALDTELKIVRSVGGGTLTLEKQKNLPDGLVWNLSATNVADTIVIEANADDGNIAVTTGMRLVAEALLDMYSGDAVATGVLLEAAGFKESRRTGERALRDLLGRELVDKPAKGRWAPTDALESWLHTRRLVDGDVS